MINKRLLIIGALVLCAGLIYIFNDDERPPGQGKEPLWKPVHIQENPQPKLTTEEKHPRAGTILSDTCIKCNKYEKIANGIGGSYLKDKGRSAFCCPETYPPYGTPLGAERRGKDKYIYMADGKGGRIIKVIQRNCCPERQAGPSNDDSPTQKARRDTLP